MPNALYTALRPKVADLLTRFGVEASLSRDTQTVDGASGSVTTTATTLWTANVVLNSQRNSFASIVSALGATAAGGNPGVNGQDASGSLVVLMPSTVDRPTAGDTIALGTRRLVVVKCDEVSPDGDPILFKAEVRDA